MHPVAGLTQRRPSTSCHTQQTRGDGSGRFARICELTNKRSDRLETPPTSNFGLPCAPTSHFVQTSIRYVPALSAHPSPPSMCATSVLPDALSVVSLVQVVVRVTDL